MRLVTMVTKLSKLEGVREALSLIGIQGPTVAEARDFGRQRSHTKLYRDAECSTNFLPKVETDMVIADDQLDKVADVISKVVYTGGIGDGKTLAAELQRVVCIHTGEADKAAL